MATFSAGTMDYKGLMHSGFQYMIASEDDKRLMPTCWRHLFWTEDYERLVPPAIGTHSGGMHRREEEPLRKSKDHKWLINFGCQHSFGY